MGKTGREPLATLEVLKNYRCQYTRDCNEEGLPLVDALTPPGETTITAGIKELASLADELDGALDTWASASIKQAVNAKLEEAAKAHCRYCAGIDGIESTPTKNEYGYFNHKRPDRVNGDESCFAEHILKLKED